MAKNSAKKLVTSQRNQWQKLLQSSANLTASGNNKDQRLRVVIDTNVWYSGILYGGKPEHAIKACLGSHEIITSAFILNELRTTLKLQARAPYKWLNALEKHLKRICTVIDVDAIPPTVRDPKDDPIVATAIKGRAAYLITGDEDLLTLQVINDLRFITIHQFLALE